MNDSCRQCMYIAIQKCPHCTRLPIKSRLWKSRCRNFNKSFRETKWRRRSRIQEGSLHFYGKPRIPLMLHLKCDRFSTKYFWSTTVVLSDLPRSSQMWLSVFSRFYKLNMEIFSWNGEHLIFQSHLQSNVSTAHCSIKHNWIQLSPSCAVLLWVWCDNTISFSIHILKVWSHNSCDSFHRKYTQTFPQIQFLNFHHMTYDSHEKAGFLVLCNL